MNNKKQIISWDNNRRTITVIVGIARDSECFSINESIEQSSKFNCLVLEMKEKIDSFTFIKTGGFYEGVYQDALQFNIMVMPDEVRYTLEKIKNVISNSNSGLGITEVHVECYDSKALHFVV